MKRNGQDHGLTIKNWTIQKPIFKKAGFQMFPDFEESDF